MEHLLTPSNITFALGVIGMFFTIFIYFKNPQTELEKKTAVEEKENEGKIGLLVKQLEWEKEASEKRFKDMAERLDSAFGLAQNHIHTVDEKLTGYIETSNKWHLEVSNQLTRLTTIIGERIPKKND